jgi:hypothetical protein
MPAELINNGPAPVVPAAPATPAASVPATPAASVPAAPTTPAAPATPAAPDPKDAIAELSRRVGRDLSRFPTVEAARAAHDMLVDDYLRAGSRPPAPAPAPAARPLDSFEPETDDDPDDDLVFDDDAAPAPKKQVRKTKRERELEKRLAKLESESTQRVRQQEDALERMVEARAVKAIDTLKSERFGNSQSWTATQRWNANELYSLALGIARGASNFGHALSIEDAIQIAASRIEPGGSAPAAPAAPAVPPPPEPRSGSLHLPTGDAALPRPVDSRYGATNAAIINDPEFRAAAARIGRA